MHEHRGIGMPLGACPLAGMARLERYTTPLIVEALERRTGEIVHPRRADLERHRVARTRHDETIATRTHDTREVRLTDPLLARERPASRRREGAAEHRVAALRR